MRRTGPVASHGRVRAGVLALVSIAVLASPVAGRDGPRTGWDPGAAPSPALGGIDASTGAAGVAPAANIIDTQDRAAVKAAYQARFVQPFGVRPGWTGSVSGCRKGTVSARYKAATLKVLNYYRGLVGLQAVTFDATLNGKAQAAALIMDANDSLSHSPPRGWRCWTKVGKEAAGNSNICWCDTRAGDMVEGYITDPGASNKAVGHRRWILWPPQRVMGVGSTAQANALWVLDIDSWENSPEDPEWIPWPPEGFVPTRHIKGRFSLSHPVADFSDATVTIVIDGRATAKKIVDRNSGYGAPTLVFQPDLQRLFKSDPKKDHVIRITVRNIKVDGTAIEHTWRTTTFWAGS